MLKFTIEEKILLALYHGIDPKTLMYRPFSYLLTLFSQLNTGSIRVVTNQMLEKGSLDKIERGGRTLLAITELGIKQLVGKPKKTSPLVSPLLAGEGKSEVKWNGKIHLVILSVPEKERATRQKIRTLLESHNYRILHAGIWFSPVKNEELLNQLKQEKLLQYVMLIEATGMEYYSSNEVRSLKDDSSRPLASNNIKDLVISAWQLTDLQKSYEKYLLEAANLQNLTHFDTSRYIILLGLQEFLLTTMRTDPYFPDDFLTLSNLRKKCWSTFLTLSQKRML